MFDWIEVWFCYLAVRLIQTDKMMIIAIEIRCAPPCPIPSISLTRFINQFRARSARGLGRQDPDASTALIRRLGLAIGFWR